MKKILLVCFVIILQAQNIKLMTEIFSPYQFYRDNKLVGISVDIVKAIQKKIGDTSKIKVYPWVRGIKILNNKKNSALFSMMRTPQRENKYLWVGPIAKLQIVFFKKKNAKITLNSIDDARKVKKIGVSKSVATYDILTAKKFKNLDVINTIDEKNIEKLIKGRIDLWPYVQAAGLYKAKKLGVSNKIEVIPNVILAKGDLYIAFNKNTNPKIIHKWQKAFDELQLSGKIDQIKREYR